MDPHRRALILGGGALVTTVALSAAAKVAPGAPPALVTTGPAPRIAAPAVVTRAAADTKEVFLHNLHTGDTVKTVYWADGQYVDGALNEARHALRDWRNGAQHDMDPGLFDVFHELSARLETGRPFQIISGYRSPATNAMLVTKSDGVSSRSLHMEGKAVDVRLVGLPLVQLRELALARRAGGVGYYPGSDFVHLDVGRVRSWSG